MGYYILGFILLVGICSEGPITAMLMLAGLGGCLYVYKHIERAVMYGKPKG